MIPIFKCAAVFAIAAGLAACSPNRQYSLEGMIDGADLLLSGEFRRRLDEERGLREDIQAKLEEANRTNEQLRDEMAGLKQKQSNLEASTVSREDLLKLERRLNALRQKSKDGSLDPETERLSKALKQALNPSAELR